MNGILMNIERSCEALISKDGLTEDDRELLREVIVFSLLARVNEKQGNDEEAWDMTVKLIAMREKITRTAERLRKLSSSVNAVAFLIYSLAKEMPCGDT